MSESTTPNTQAPEQSNQSGQQNQPKMAGGAPMTELEKQAAADKAKAQTQNSYGNKA